MARTRYRIVDGAHPYFLTCTIVAWHPIFSGPECAQIVLDSLAFLQGHERLILYGYVIMENHLHLVAHASDLSKEVGDFKSFTARQIIDFLHDRKETTVLSLLENWKLPHKSDRTYQLWQEGNKPKQIQDDATMLQKLEYTHNNPVRRGYVDEPTHWRYSSARNYAGVAGLIPVTTEW